jgi:hypothetical protein
MCTFYLRLVLPGTLKAHQKGLSNLNNKKCPDVTECGVWLVHQITNWNIYKCPQMKTLMISSKYSIWVWVPKWLFRKKPKCVYFKEISSHHLFVPGLCVCWVWLWHWENKIQKDTYCRDSCLRSSFSSFPPLPPPTDRAENKDPALLCLGTEQFSLFFVVCFVPL